MYELMPSENKYVQIIEIKDNGFVEFYFAVGEATMNVELILPYKAFIEFCQNNRVAFFSKKQEDDLEKDNEIWKNGLN